MAGTQGDQTTLIAAPELEGFCRELLAAAGLPQEDSAIVAASLVEANLRGVDTHGVMRLPTYVRRFHRIEMESVAVVSDQPAAAVLDGGNRPGPVVTMQAMGLAVEKARQTGVAFVTARRTNHFGAAAYYSMRAAEEGLIGFAAATASPRIAPWGGKTAMLGNNPWSVAVPFRPGFPLVVDMALSVVAAGKIRQLLARGEELPPGWGLDRDGRPTRDPQAALQGLLMPIGGHKGVGMSLLLDWLAAGLSDGAFAQDVVPLDRVDHPQNVCVAVAAIRIDAFVDPARFAQRLEDYVARYKGSAKSDEAVELVLPGELEHRTALERRQKGIPLPPYVVKGLNDAAQEVGCPARL